MSMKEKMHTGELYLPNDEEIMNEQLQRLERLYDFNATRPLEQEKRTALLKEMFAEIGEGCYIEPPFHSNFGGGHVHFGKNIYANFNLSLSMTLIFMWVIIQCLVRISQWLRQGIRFCQSCAVRGTNIMRLFI